MKLTVTRSSNFPHWSHNEDDPEFEEVWQGYEEKEVGTLFPERFADYPNIEVVTYWVPLNNGSGRFTSETELRNPLMVTTSGFRMTPNQ